MHYFWGNVERLLPFSVPGKALSLSIFGICMVLLVYRLYEETFTL
jgi:hypothetical protein